MPFSPLFLYIYIYMYFFLFPLNQERMKSTEAGTMLMCLVSVMLSPLCSWMVVPSAAQQSTDPKEIIRQHLKEAEDGLKSLVERTKALLQQFQCRDQDCTSVCSLLECGSSQQELKCDAADGSGQLDACDCSQGRWSSHAASSISAQMSIKTAASATARNFICATRELEKFWLTESQKKPFWHPQTVPVIGGGAPPYPAELQWRSNQGCEGLEIKHRSWFVAATSGPKNIVLVIDTSGSMGARVLPVGTRLTLVVAAILTLIEGLTPADAIGCVRFSSAATVTFEMSPATMQNSDALKKAMRTLSPGGSTNFGPGFRLAMNMFASAERTGFAKGCKNIMVFFTDGAASDAKSAMDLLRDLQSKMKQKVHVFTYTMSSGASLRAPTEIACGNDGVWTHIQDGGNVMDVLSNFNKLTLQTKQIGRWTAPYEDSYGQTTVVSASSAIVVDSTPVAVAAIDIELEKLWHMAGVIGAAKGEMLAWLQDELAARSAECIKVVPKAEQCHLQSLRHDSDPGRALCPAPAPSLNSCTFPPVASAYTGLEFCPTNVSELFCNSVSTQDELEGKQIALACVESGRCHSLELTGGTDGSAVLCLGPAFTPTLSLSLTPSATPTESITLSLTETPTLTPTETLSRTQSLTLSRTLCVHETVASFATAADGCVVEMCTDG